MNKSLVYQKLKQIKSLSEECIAELSLIEGSIKLSPKKDQKKSERDFKSIDFNINIRGFMKRYSKGMNGQKKFTLLTAYLAKGKTDASINWEEIKKNWNQMSGLLGGKLTSRSNGTRAKEDDWLNSPKKGAYQLSDNWKGIFGNRR